MRRLTTPQHSFGLPFDVAAIERIKVSYAQTGKIVLEKNDDEISLEGSTATVSLSQEETKMFSSKYLLEIQVRILTKGKDALASNTISIQVADVLNDEVME